MSAPRPLPDGFRGRAFTVARAREAGIGPNRLRRSDLVAPRRGVRAPASRPLDALDQLVLRSLTVPDGHWFSHTSAARLHGLWLPTRLEAGPSIHLSCSDAGARRGGRHTRGHVVAAGIERVVRVHGLAVQSPADTWASLHTLLTPDELVILGDQLVRRKRPLCTMAELAAAVARRRRRRGVRILDAALSRIRPGTDSVKESELRLLVVSWGFAEPVVNPTITADDGSFLALGDLVWLAHRTVLEYDGDHHRSDPRTHDQDLDRLDRLSDARWEVIRVTARRLRRPHWLRARLEALLPDRGH